MSDLKPLPVYVLHATDADKAYIKIYKDGCLGIFDDEISAKTAKRRYPGTDVTPVNYYTEKQVAQLKERIVELEARAVVPEWFDPSRNPPKHSAPVIGFHPEWVDVVNKDGVRECFTTSDGGVWLSAFWPEGEDSYQTVEMTPKLWTHMPTPAKQEQES
jgi:hypothetical protein